MQKKIIAVAVAGLMSGAAFAQSNVTVYGIVDAAYVNLSTNNDGATAIKSKQGIDSSGLAASRIGFRGTEDLGNGLRANFVLEYQINVDQNQAVGAANARQQTIGLSGNFGTVQAGRMLTLTAAHNGRYAALFGTALSAEAQVRGANGTGWDYANRVSNTVAYVSPNMSGFTVAAARVFGVDGNDGEIRSNVSNNAQTAAAGFARQTAWDLSANYANGPLGVGLAYQSIGNTSTAADTDGSKQTTLGASYDLGVVRLMANHTSYKVNTVGTRKGKGYSLSAVAPVGAGNVHLSYATSKGTAVAANQGAKSWSLAYTHGLSKRTTAYVGYSNADAKLGSTATFYGAAVEADKKARLFAAGLSHAF